MKTGYKATYNFTCKDHKFEIGETYELQNKPIPCEYGFHYCLNPIDVLEYYDINPEFRLLEIEDLSSETITEGNKSVTNKIRIVREIPISEYRSSMGFVGNELKINSKYVYWTKIRFDERNNCIYKQNRHDFWVKYQFDERNNLIYWENSLGDWVKFQYNENNELIKKNL